MNIGDAVPVKSIRVMVPNGWLNYKAPDGEYFVLLLLGTQPIKGEPLKPDEALVSLGWEFVDDREQDSTEADEALVERVAEAIAINGVGRPWDDIPEVDVHDLCRIDIRDYARAAIAGIVAARAAA